MVVYWTRYEDLVQAGTSCTARILRRIIAAPVTCRWFKRSCKKMNPANAANTVSELIIIAVSVAVVYRWATTCSVNAIPTERIPAYRITG